MTRCAYIFLDEAGNFDFGANGTRYFVLTTIGMRRPSPAFEALDNYKHDCLENGADVEYFHCYNDRKIVRNTVFDLIATHIGGMHIDFLVVEKAGIASAMQDGTRFYPAMLGHMLSLVVPIELGDNSAEEIIVITDTIPVNRKRRAVEKAVRTTLARTLPSRVKYRVLHHQSRSHYGLQVADYCCWAVLRKWERRESTWYDQIKPAVRNEFKIVGAGRQL